MRRILGWLLCWPSALLAGDEVEVLSRRLLDMPYAQPVLAPLPVMVTPVRQVPARDPFSRSTLPAAVAGPCQAAAGVTLALPAGTLDEALQEIARQRCLSLVSEGTTQLPVTVQLQDLEWQRALDVLLEARGFHWQVRDGLLHVTPVSTAVPVPDTEVAPGTLERLRLPLNHASARDALELLQRMDARAAASIVLDERTNSLLLPGQMPGQEQLRQAVEQLDVPLPQVFIEARLVEVNVDYSQALGVRWGGRLGMPGEGWQLAGGIAEAGQAGNLVDLEALAASSGVGVGFVSGQVLLDMRLSAMEKSGNGEVISRPGIMTTHGQVASIKRGMRIPYQEASASGSTSTSWIDAALGLQVMPRITDDGKVMMDIKVNKDEPDFSNAVNGAPSVRNNEVQVRVLVADGETVVIGGVYSDVSSEQVERVPLLGRIPLLGRLFRQKVENQQKQELLVFLTPSIMGDQPTVSSR